MKPLDKPQYSILIVDDEKENLTGFKYLFDDEYQIFTAASAAEAEEILRRNEIQVIISDQRMPEKTGVEFLEEVVHKYPETARMILTGYSDFDAIIKAINSGRIYYYFSKPWNEGEMRLIIKNAIESIELKKALKISESNFRQLSESVKEIFWLYDTDWSTLHFVSPTFEKIFNTSSKTLFDKPLKWIDQIVPEDRGIIQAFLGDVGCRLDETTKTPEFRVATPEGTVRWISFNISPVKDQNGKTYRLAGLMEDVTENKQATESLIQSEKIMSMGGMAAGMAHELNNPLSAIIQATQVLRRKLGLDNTRKIEEAEAGFNVRAYMAYIEEKGVPKMLDNISKSAFRASKLISEMLSFSRKSDSAKEKVDLRALLDNILHIAMSDYDMKHKYRFDKIDLKKEVDEQLPPVFCNDVEIGQVFLNLFQNAAQAIANDETDKKPMIVVRVSREMDYVTIEFEDNGPGMSENTIQKAFEPFYTTKSKGKGTGLGLSIVKKIITENHCGSIRIKSQVDEGTCFIIKIPVAGP